MAFSKSSSFCKRYFCTPSFNTQAQMNPTMNAPAGISEDAKQLASGLLKIGAVKFNMDSPFTWVSGIKSPIYCDNRMINSHVDVRKEVIAAFAREIKRRYANVEVIAGVATGGISFASLIAGMLDLPMIYVREKAKEHGMMKQIEGEVPEGSRVVLIEDHISTGGSSLKAATAIKNAGLELLGLISIMQYGFDVARARFQEENVAFSSLCDLDTVVEVAVDKGILTKADRDSITTFRKDPAGWAGTR